MPRPKVQGYRRRFNFILTEENRDRVVADWLNRQPNASEAIKSLIYAVATGDTLEVPVSWAEPGVRATDLDDKDPRVKALWGAVDT